MDKAFWDPGELEMNFLSRNSFLRLLAAQRASVCVCGGPRLPGKEPNCLSGKTSEAKLWQWGSIPARGLDSHRVRLPKLRSPHFFKKNPLAKLTFSRLFKPWPCPSLLRKAKNEIPFPKFVFGAPESWKCYMAAVWSCMQIRTRLRTWGALSSPAPKFWQFGFKNLRVPWPGD